MTPTHAHDRFWAVVPAGGPGSRLWPVSRADSPKFLHDLTGSGRSLLQATVDRVRSVAGDRIVIVTGAAHAEAVRQQVPDLPQEMILAEPSPRDSMAAIGLAAACLERHDPEAIIGSFAADHVIADGAAFAAAVGEAVEVAATDDLLVTVGIDPTYPATGFGYIQQGPKLPGHRTASRVRQFVEKPDAQRAASYLATGEFRWNAGMFVVRATTLLDLLARWHPDLAAGLREIAADRSRMDEIWPGLERIAIDHALAEPAADEGRVAVVPAPFDWDDVGDFNALAGLLPHPEGTMRVVGNPADVCAIDADGLVVTESGRMVAVLGLDDVVIVETDDALLVTSRERAQDVRLIVQALKEAGRTDMV